MSKIKELNDIINEDVFPSIERIETVLINTNCVQDMDDVFRYICALEEKILLLELDPQSKLLDEMAEKATTLIKTCKARYDGLKIVRASVVLDAILTKYDKLKERNNVNKNTVDR